MAALDNGRGSGIEGHRAASHLLYEEAKIACVHAGIAALVDYLDDIFRADKREGQVQSARSPSARDRHFRR